MDDGDDTIMEGTSARIPIGVGRPPATNRSRSLQPVSGINGNANPSLTPSLLEPFQKPLPLPISRPLPMASTAAVVNEVPGQLSSSSRSEEEADSFVEDDSDVSDEQPRQKGLPLSSLPTGLCYDIRMRYHCEVMPTADVHPEDPRRIHYIYKELCEAGLVEDDIALKPLVKNPLKRIDARNATEEEICTVHEKKHFDFVEYTSRTYLLI